jgi:HEAT repeat protein
MADQELFGNMVKSFHLSITYLRIYPPTSQMVLHTFEALFKTMNSLFETESNITLSNLSGKLLLNGQEPPNHEIELIAKNITKLFEQRNINSITFRKGVERSEVDAFFADLIRKKREELPEYRNIALDQTVYVPLIKGEEVVAKISQTINNSGDDIAGIMTSVREAYDLIDGLPDTAMKEQSHNQLAQELAKKDANVLREIFERDLPLKMESTGLKPRILSALSNDKIQAIFGDISQWYEEVRQKGSSDFMAVEHLEKLKIFIQTILQAPAAKEIPPQFFEELLRKGLLEQLPDWLSPSPAKPKTIFEVERILENEPVFLLEKEVMDTLPSLVEKLCYIDNNELLGRLIEKLLENLKNTAAKIRLLAAKTMAGLYEILQAQTKENILKFTELPLLEAAKHETSSEVHFYLVELLRLRARQNILHNEYELALRIIDLLKQHASDDMGSDKNMKANAASAEQKLISEIMDVLINDLKSSDENKHLGSLQIFSKIGPKSIEALVKVIKESPDIRARKLAAMALSGFGPEAKKRFSEELNLGLIPEEIARVVEVLPELGTSDMLEQMSNLILYPEPNVKKEIMRFLGKLNTAQARIILIEQLKDRDPAIISEAVRLLGELACKEAVPNLITLLSQSQTSTVLQEEITVALGMIQDIRSVPALISKLNKKFSLFPGSAQKNERVRMRAAWALRKFSGQAVEQSLEKASKDKTPLIAVVARESLALIKKPG